MNPDDDKKNFDAKVAEAKTGIDRLLSLIHIWFCARRLSAL